MLYSGVTGKLSIAEYSGETAGTAKDIAHMGNWSVELSREMIEAVSFGNTYKEKVPSIKDWSANFDGKADFAATSCQKDLVDAFENGTKLKGSYYLDATTFLVGDCYIESLSITHAADGASDISISVAGSNAVKLTVPAATI